MVKSVAAEPGRILFQKTVLASGGLEGKRCNDG
jgi:hypothetical protein